jgi:ATP-dependent Clp protease protease subunit
MSLDDPVGTWPWPPKVPPHQPPHQPPWPTEPPRQAPVPILPSWEEHSLERDIADQLRQRRVVVVGGRLDDSLANHATAQLLLLSRGDDRPIELHLTCPGADLDPSLALADAVELIDAPAHAVVRGILHGPALAVLCAAVKRAAHRHAVLVLTLPAGAGEGTAHDLAVLAEQYERQVTRLRDRIAELTGRPASEAADRPEVPPGALRGGGARLRAAHRAALNPAGCPIPRESWRWLPRHRVLVRPPPQPPAVTR